MSLVIKKIRGVPYLYLVAGRGNYIYLGNESTKEYNLGNIDRAIEYVNERVDKYLQVKNRLFDYPSKAYLDQSSLDLIPSKSHGIFMLLDKCTLIKGPMRVVEKAVRMIQKSEKSIQAVVDGSAGSFLSKTVIRKLNTVKNFEYYQVAKFKDKPKFRYKIIKAGGKLRRAANKDVYVGILLADGREAAFVFPKKEGELNWNFGFYSKDEDVVEWTKSVFNDIWTKSKVLMPL